MSQITTITLPLPLGLGTVNAYLVRTDDGFILIDTGAKSNQSMLMEQLRSAACAPGKIRLVLITHGDFDHTGNAAYIQREYGADIAIHTADRAMLENGDMFANRQNGNVVLRWLAPRMFGFGKEQHLIPDVSLTDGMNLNAYGWNARVLSFPGHSLGSTGILTDDGVLFCGDLLDNSKSPAPTTLVGNPELIQSSVEKVIALKPNLIYPGHGAAFTLADLKTNLAIQ